MSPKNQKNELAQSTIRDCTEALVDLMATFKTYSGKHLDIDRGDFDVEFFKELHGKCSAIHRKLESLALVLGTSEKPRQRPNTGISRTISVKLSPVM